MLLRRNPRIIYDFDDALFQPNTSEANQRFAPLKRPPVIGMNCRVP